jgi:hypothetical protein
LLAYLVVVRRPTSRDALAALLWPEADGTDARNALRRTLSVLRSGLGGRGLVVDRSAVALEEGSVEADLWRFRAALALARGHGHPASDACSTCVAALDEALAWDRGPFMEGFALRDSEVFDDWQAAEGEAPRRDLAGALERLPVRAPPSDAGFATRRPSAGSVDPLHEPLTSWWSRRSGDQIAQYRDSCAPSIGAGRRPLPETADLAEAIRDSRLGPDQTAEPTTRPVRADPASPAVHVATRWRRWSADERGAVMRDEDRNGMRLLLIEGEAGVGKTRLAEAVVDRVRASGSIVLEARTIAGESTIPFAVIAELIRVGSTQAGAEARIAALAPRWQVDAARPAPLPAWPSTARGRQRSAVACASGIAQRRARGAGRWNGRWAHLGRRRGSR